MTIHLPSGCDVKIETPADDFPRLIDEAELRESKAHEDVVLLKKLARQMEAWPVASAAEGGAK